MLYYLFMFFMDIIGHIFNVWSMFQVIPGVSYLEFYCAAIILSLFAYIIFGPIKTAIKQEAVYSIRPSVRRTKTKIYNKINGFD